MTNTAAANTSITTITTMMSTAPAVTTTTVTDTIITTPMKYSPASVRKPDAATLWKKSPLLLPLWKTKRLTA